MKKTFVKYGIFYAIVSIILSLLVWLTCKHLFANMSISFLFMALPFPFFILACREEKAMNDGYLDFGKAFITCMGIAIVGVIISSVFSYFLYNIIDPGLEDYIKSIMIENLAKYESTLGEDAYDNMIEKFENMDLTSIGIVIRNLFTILFVQVFVALAAAGIMKKNKPAIFDI